MKLPYLFRFRNAAPTKPPDKPGKVLSLIRPDSRRIEAMDIGTWRTAMDGAQSKQFPTFHKLQDMYDNVLLDSHLAGVWEKRRLNIVLSELVYNDANGQPIEAVNKVFTGQKWIDFLSVLMDTKLRGYNIVQFEPGDGTKFDFYHVPYRNVMPVPVPMVLKSYSDRTGEDVTQAPYAATTTFIDSGTLGILATVSKDVIYKRNCMGDFSQYLEQFAMPLQAVTTTSNDPATRDQAKAMLEAKGSNAGMMVPEGMDLRLVSGASSASNDGYERFINLLDAQISKAILGQTMTTDDGASLSQAKVHKAVNDAIDKADRLWAVAWLNEQFSRFMPLWGVQAVGTWAFNEDAGETLAEQLANDKALKELLPDVDDQYFYDKYQVPRKAATPPPQPLI